MHALEYAIHGGPNRTAGVVEGIRYIKDHARQTSGMRGSYDTTRGLYIANHYPKNVRLGMGPRTSSPTESTRGVRHFLNTRGFTPIRVTNPDRFATAEDEFRSIMARAQQAWRDADRAKIARRAEGTGTR